MNILVMTFGSHGDVHPFLGIAKTLRQRGHGVKFMANPYFESLVGAVGLDFVPLGNAGEFETIARDPRVWHWFGGMRKIGRSVGDSIRQSYQAILQHAVPGKTVLVYSTLAFGARVAQETLKLPGVTVHLAPAIFLSADAPPALNGADMPAWLPRAARRMILDAGETLLLQPLFGRPVNAYRAELGLPPVRRVMSQWCHSPQRVIGMFPDWYAPKQRDWPPQTVLSGFPLYDEKDVTPLPPPLEGFLNSGSPPIAFTPGSAMFFGHGFFAAAVDACQKLGRRGVLLTRHAEQIPANLPPNMIHSPFAPFGLLLPRCAAVVHHGGIGSTAQGLACGVPQLLMPMNFDQPDNAHRVRKLGVGDWLAPRRFTGETAAAALGRLIESHDVSEACRAIARKLAGDHALERTAECIEQLRP
jgi:rhamnosyltransferase subunit B